MTLLMCTLNGERFLSAQLASLEQQTHRNWRLIVSDDGSTDATRSILNHFAQRVPQPVELREGPRRGATANFMMLAADPELKGEYFAFCDQDDVWHPDKLRHALELVKTAEGKKDLPVVYGGRTRLVQENGDPYGYAQRFAKPPSFANALAQSVAGANTMVFNRAAKQLFEAAGPVKVVSHDWWAYQLVTGSGGIFRYDTEPHVDYRQHSENCIGCNRGLRAQWKRFRMVLDGGYAHWNGVNLAALEACQHLLTEDARAEIAAYQKMRDGGLLRRLRTFATSRIRRQTLLGNFALLTAVVLKKL